MPRQAGHGEEDDADFAPQEPKAGERRKRVEHVVTAVLLEVQGQKQQLGAKGMGQRRLHGRLELTPSSRGCDSEEGAQLCVTTQQRGCGAGQGRAAGA